MKRLISLRFAALLFAAMLTSASAHGQSQTSIGYVDGYGNWVLTTSSSTLESAFAEELDYNSDASVHNATFTNVSIMTFDNGTTHELVATGSNGNYMSIVAHINVTVNLGGSLYINASSYKICHCPDGTCPPKCDDPALCPCTSDSDPPHDGNNHLGSFY